MFPASEDAEHDRFQPSAPTLSRHLRRGGRRRTARRRRRPRGGGNRAAQRRAAPHAAGERIQARHRQLFAPQLSARQSAGDGADAPHALRELQVGARAVRDHGGGPRGMAAKVEAAGIPDRRRRHDRLHKDTDADVEKYFMYAGARACRSSSPCWTAVGVPRIEKFAKRYDIKVAIHNHGPEDKNFRRRTTCSKAVKGMDPRMGLASDVGHRRAGTEHRAGRHSTRARACSTCTSRISRTHGPRSQVARRRRHPAHSRRSSARSERCTSGLREPRVRDQREGSTAGHEESLAYMRGVLAGVA